MKNSKCLQMVKALGVMFCTALFLQGCLGGGTLATGLGEGFNEGQGLSSGTMLVRLRGRVVDTQRRPLAGVKVSAVSVSGAAEAVSDTKGAFNVVLESTVYSIIEVNLSGYGMTSRATVRMKQDGLIEQDFVLGNESRPTR